MYHGCICEKPSFSEKDNNKKRSHTQLDSRKQVIAFQDRVITINIKEAQHPLNVEKFKFNVEKPGLSDICQNCFP